MAAYRLSAPGPNVLQQMLLVVSLVNCETRRYVLKQKGGQLVIGDERHFENSFVAETMCI